MTSILSFRSKTKTQDGLRRVTLVISPMSKELARLLPLSEHVTCWGYNLSFGSRRVRLGWDTATLGEDSVMSVVIVR
jgi:hypothetical protein